MKLAGVEPSDVIGIGVDFTSCTMLPCLPTERRSASRTV